MKLRLLVGYILCLQAPLLFGQWTFFRQGSSAEKVRGKPVYTNGYVFLNVAGMEPTTSGACYIYRYDSAGNSEKYNFGKFIWNMQPTLDGKLLAVSQERRCSYQLDTLDYFLEKISNTGSVVASASLEVGAAEIVQTNDSSFVVFLWDNKTMLRFDKNLNLLATTPHTLGNIQGSMLCSDGKIAVAHLGNAGQRLSILNATGQQLSSQTLTFSPTIMRPKGNNQITLFAIDKFYVYDYSLSLVSVKPVKYLTDYYMQNDSLFAVYPDSAGLNPVYGVFNSNMHVVFKTALNSYYATALCKVNNKVAIVFEPNIISYGRVNHCLSVHPKLAMLNPQKNMSISMFDADSSYYVARSDGFYDVYARLNIVFSNWGPGVNKFRLSVETHPDKICGKNYYWQSFNQPVAQAGYVSAEIPGFLHCQTKLYKGIISGTYCAVVSQIDDEFDATPATNVFCIYPYFEMTGLKDQAALARKVQVFPNPVEGNLTIVSEEEMNGVEVMTMQGELLSSMITSGFRNTIDMSALPPGLYMVRVTSGGGTVVKKVVTQ